LETEIVVLRDFDNLFMKRKELRLVLKNAAGRLTKTEAVNLIAAKNNIETKRIVAIRMNCSYGKPDVDASFHIYESEEAMKDFLPRHRNLRLLGKAERKKIIDEEKAAKLKAKQAALESSKSGKKNK
jgi:small subunit ribosomal protein S24e